MRGSNADARPTPRSIAPDSFPARRSRWAGIWSEPYLSSPLFGCQGIESPRDFPGALVCTGQEPSTKDLPSPWSSLLMEFACDRLEGSRRQGPCVTVLDFATDIRLAL